MARFLGLATPRVRALAPDNNSTILTGKKKLGRGIMELARITSKGQMTIPRRVRQAANLAEGDVVTFAVEGETVTLRKLRSEDDAYLGGVQETLSEWNSAEDEDAWRDL
jgi:antitoxin PrlF